MSHCSVCAVLFVVLASAPVAASSEGFLGGHRRLAGHRGSTGEDFEAAMATVMGCGGGVASEHLFAVEQVLAPMWRVLPKNQHDLVEWRMVRYLAHRYFMQQSSLLVRGFEPMRQINATHFGDAEILSAHVPSLVEAALDGKRSSNGFSLKDAVAMVTTLDQLIIDTESTLLDIVYKQQRKSPKQTLDHAELSNVMEAYMVHWMMDGDESGITMLLRNKTLLQEVLPKWNDIRGFVEGVVKTMEFGHQRLPKPGHAQAVLAGQFSFEEAHEVVGGITRKFASFWENECQVIKESLVALDKSGTGRVKLSDFYGANADGEWRFGESEAYLRELGALDESSPWQGKQVIIPNYMQGASNCIVSTPHYLVCCVSECEAVLNEVEDAVGGPVAQPDLILPLIQNMSGLDDEAPKLDAALKLQLSRIAETHRGKVPLHGRLFAQWLHYVFPRECPFPHKAGMHSALSPSQFGENYMASVDEVSGHASARNEGKSLEEDHEEAQWMSQWSEEEELIGDYSLQLRAPWESSHRMALGGTAIVALVLMAAGVFAGNGKASKQSVLGGAFEHKSHFV